MLPWGSMIKRAVSPLNFLATARKYRLASQDLLLWETENKTGFLSQSLYEPLVYKDIKKPHSHRCGFFIRFEVS